MAASCSGGTTDARPATPMTTPNQPRSFGSAPLRSATTLTSRTHSPPRISPPAPPSACATGSIACHASAGLRRVRLGQGDDGGHSVVEDHPARDQRNRPQQADSGSDTHRGGRASLQSVVERERQHAERDPVEHVGDEVHRVQARVVGDHERDLLRGGRLRPDSRPRAGSTASRRAMRARCRAPPPLLPSAAWRHRGSTSSFPSPP